MGNPIDIICALVMVYGFWFGYNRGIISTVFTIFGYALGLVFAFKAIPITANMLENISGQDNPMMSVAAFIVNLLVLGLIIRFISRGMENTLDYVYLGVFNRLLGGALMAYVAALIFSVLLWFGVKAQFVGQNTLRTARTYENFLQALPTRARVWVSYLRPFLTEAWDGSLDWMNRLEQFGLDKQNDKPKIYEIPDENAGIEDKPAIRRMPDEGDGIEQ